jgi:hypothetical protein
MDCCSKKEQEVLEEILDENKELDFLLNKETNSKKRLAICLTCSELIKFGNICSQCGCLMNIKTRIFSASCPLNKW